MQVTPSSIKIRPGLERFRKDLGNIEELAHSIQTKGQLQPIVVNEQMELIAGGRRLAACTLYNMPVEIKIISESDSLAMRELEVEENVQRLDFTPSEHVLAVKELHELKSKIADSKGQSWSIQDTADVIGMDRSSVSKYLSLAEVVQAFPQLAECKTKSELQIAANTINKLIDRATAITTYESRVDSMENVKLSNLDAYEFMKTIPDNSIDIFLCDPPYGIDIFENAIGIGGATGGDSTIAGFFYDDSAAKSLSLIQFLCQESYRVCKDTSVMYLFVGPEFYSVVLEMLRTSGWSPSIKPMIWNKPGQGQANAPEHWPVSSYEMLLFARRKDSRLLYARPDVLTYERVSPQSRFHPSQKPESLLRDLITRSVHPGATLLDPCMGSGASIVAGLKEKLICIGNDKLEAAYSAAVEYVNKSLEEV